jgi:hypothetical protein
MGDARGESASAHDGARQRRTSAPLPGHYDIRRMLSGTTADCGSFQQNDPFRLGPGLGTLAKRPGVLRATLHRLQARGRSGGGWDRYGCHDRSVDPGGEEVGDGALPARRKLAER